MPNLLSQSRKHVAVALLILCFLRRGPSSLIRRSWANNKDWSSKGYQEFIETISPLLITASPPIYPKENILIHMFIVLSQSCLSSLLKYYNSSEINKQIKLEYTQSIYVRTVYGDTSLSMILCLWKLQLIENILFLWGVNKSVESFKYGLLLFKKLYRRYMVLTWTLLTLKAKAWAISLKL